MLTVSLTQVLHLLPDKQPNAANYFEVAASIALLKNIVLAGGASYYSYSEHPLLKCEKLLHQLWTNLTMKMLTMLL
jgi:hypothetical protein|tara:strand:- start:584 stop:811 length:228 start_codon:yes stop_codon:yes gene_type:complete